MTVKHATVALSTSAASLLGSVADAPTGRSAKAAVARTIVGKAVADLYIGGPGVTSAAYGVKITSGETFSFDLKPGDVLYAALASGTASQPVLHLGV